MSLRPLSDYELDTLIRDAEVIDRGGTRSNLPFGPRIARLCSEMRHLRDQQAEREYAYGLEPDA